MISQRCPKCYSSRIRAGYRPTPLWSKMLFIFNLLCDNCNWQFKGFAVPGTVSSKSRSGKKKQPETDVTNLKIAASNKEVEPKPEDKNGHGDAGGNQHQLRKKVKVKLRA